MLQSSLQISWDLPEASAVKELPVAGAKAPRYLVQWNPGSAIGDSHQSWSVGWASHSESPKALCNRRQGKLTLLQKKCHRVPCCKGCCLWTWISWRGYQLPPGAWCWFCFQSASEQCSTADLCFQHCCLPCLSWGSPWIKGISKNCIARNSISG